MFLKSLTLSNILSFGPEPHTVELGPLNVIIGPNGSGKSNFIEAVGLLKAAPRDIREPVREGGGIGEWLWKSNERHPIAFLAIEIEFANKSTINYKIEFSVDIDRIIVVREKISSEEQGEDVFIIVEGETVHTDAGNFQLNKKGQIYDYEQSVLSQLREPFSPLRFYFLGSSSRV